MPETIETKQLTTADLANAANGRDRGNLTRRSSREQESSARSVFGPFASVGLFGGYADPMGGHSDRLRR